MPISINDYMNLIDQPGSLGLFRNLHRLNNLLKVFPVVEVGALVVRGQQWKSLPVQGFRDLNESFTESTGKTEPVEDRLAIWGGKFSVDKAYGKLKRDPLYKDPAEQQYEMHTKSMDRGISENIFNGDIDDDPKGFEGLWKRFQVGDFPADCVFPLSDVATFYPRTDQASAQYFFEVLDHAMHQIGLFNVPEVGTVQGAIFTNQAGFLGFQAAARLTGYSLYTRDLLGHTWTTYREVPIVDVGLQYDRATEIIGNEYESVGETEDSTRIYVVRFAQADTVDWNSKEAQAQAVRAIENPGGDGLTIVQAGMFERVDPVQALRTEEHGVEWIMGISHVGDSYCAAVLTDLSLSGELPD